MLTFGQLRRLIDHKTSLTVQIYTIVLQYSGFHFCNFKKCSKLFLTRKKRRDSIFAKAVAFKGPTQRQLYYLHCKLYYPTNPALYHLTQRATTFGVDLTGRFKHQSKLRYWLFSPLSISKITRKAKTTCSDQPTQNEEGSIILKSLSYGMINLAFLP